MTTQNTESNGGLYFIVGALVVAVAVMGFFFISGSSTNMSQIEPASGIERAVDQTTSSFEVEIDENGVSGTSTQSTEN